MYCSPYHVSTYVKLRTGYARMIALLQYVADTPGVYTCNTSKYVGVFHVFYTYVLCSMYSYRYEIARRSAGDVHINTSSFSHITSIVLLVHCSLTAFPKCKYNWPDYTCASLYSACLYPTINTGISITSSHAVMLWFRRKAINNRTFKQSYELLVLRVSQTGSSLW